MRRFADRRHAARPSPASDWAELVKLRLSGLVVLTAAVSHLLARHGMPDSAGGGPAGGPLPGLVLTSLGTALAAFGANAVNQAVEGPRDALMERTRDRPVPAGRVSARRALAAGFALAGAGTALLGLAVNALAAGLAAACFALYAGVYTPLKTRSSLCTLVGAVCGALPPLIGWAGAEGRLSLGGWLLAATLFVWQIPHFLALAWLYRDDYARGGFRMLPVTDRHGALTVRLLVLYSLVLLPIGLLVSLSGMSGRTFALGSLLLGLGLAAAGARLWRERSDGNARRVFYASLAYLPLLLLLMVADPGARGRPRPAFMLPHEEAAPVLAAAVNAAAPNAAAPNVAGSNAAGSNATAPSAAALNAAAPSAAAPSAAAPGEPARAGGSS